MKKNIRIIAERSSDLPKELLEKYNIHMVGINVCFGEESFIVGPDTDTETFYNKMKESRELPKTSSPSPDRFIELFDCEEDVIVLTLTSKLSSTYSSAELAKTMYLEEHKNKKIEVIDTMSGSIGSGLLILKAAQLAQEGKTIEEVVEEIEKYKKEIVFYGVLDTLENAIKGGRVNPIAGKLINALNFKVVIKIDEGLVKPVDKARGEVNSIKKLLEKVKSEVENTPHKTISIGHANCLEKALKIKKLIEENSDFKDIVIAEISPVMATYTAEGAILIAVL